MTSKLRRILNQVKPIKLGEQWAVLVWGKHMKVHNLAYTTPTASSAPRNTSSLTLFHLIFKLLHRTRSDDEAEGTVFLMIVEILGHEDISNWTTFAVRQWLTRIRTVFDVSGSHTTISSPSSFSENVFAKNRAFLPLITSRWSWTSDR